MLGHKIRDAEDKSGKRKRGIIWDMTIPKEAERGNYKAIVIIYDVETKRWLAYREKSIEVE